VIVLDSTRILSDALKEAHASFDDFDRRVVNQHIFDLVKQAQQVVPPKPETERRDAHV